MHPRCLVLPPAAYFLPAQKVSKDAPRGENPGAAPGKVRPARAGIFPPWVSPSARSALDERHRRSAPPRRSRESPIRSICVPVRRAFAGRIQHPRRCRSYAGTLFDCAPPGDAPAWLRPRGCCCTPPIRPFGAPSPHMGGRAFAGMRRENAPPRVFSNGTEKPPAAAQEAVGGRDLRLGL